MTGIAAQTNHLQVESLSFKVAQRSDGLRVVRRPFCSHHHLEEGVWHRHAMLAHGVVALAVEYGSRHDVYLSIASCPVPACLFQVFPVALVQVAVLRADVGHQESLLLRLVRPLVVARRAHVSSLIATLTLPYVGVGGPWLRQSRLGRTALQCPLHAPHPRLLSGGILSH